jgi:glycosyltransferase involved in cell wall biosynthesis
MNNSNKVAAVIPCFKVTKHILGVISQIGPEVTKIYVVDDCCPDKSGMFALNGCKDPRLEVIFNKKNLGVGGAVMVGYQKAIEDGADVIVKVDGDGQMDCSEIPKLIFPILKGQADYTKGNRFFNLENIYAMPKIRLFGNAALSMMTKLSSGYWDLFDPTNGFTAIRGEVASLLPFQKISSRYFFETDILFRLNILRAVAIDVPMDAKYGDEISNLKISKIFLEFLGKHIRNFFKRIFYNYYLRDMSLASFELPIGVGLLTFGAVFGGYHWMLSSRTGITTPAGTVMVSALCLLIGLQLVLAFLSYDIESVPRRPLHSKISKYLT